MRTLLMSLGILFSLSLTGCPTPPEEAAGPQGGPQGGPPAGGAGGPPPGTPPAGDNQGNPGDAPPAEGGAALAPTAVPPNGGAPGAMGAPPSFSTLLGVGDPTITITVKIEGATAGQVDFQTIDTSGDNPAPHALHVEKFGEDGIAKATAPATYPEPIYIVADSYSNGTSLSPGDPVGAYAEPITLSGEDLELTIHIGDSAEWLSKGGGPPPGATPGQAPGGALTPPATPPQQPTAPAPTDAGGEAPE